MLKWFEKFGGRLAPQLTWTRILIAIAIAVTADTLQIILGPLGWVFIDGLIDLVAMVLVMLVLGFHPLLLPTFVVELVPLADMLPTWTGCVIAVIALRKRAQREIPSIQTDVPSDEKPLPEKMARRTDANL